MSPKIGYWIAIHLLITEVLATLSADKFKSFLDQRIIFDITSFDSFELNHSSTTTKADYTISRRLLCEYLYFSIDYKNRNETFRRYDKHTKWYMNSSKIGYHKISGMSFIFNSDNLLLTNLRRISVPLSKEAVQEFSNGDHNISALLFHIDPMLSSQPVCICEHFSNGLKQLFQDSLNLYKLSDDDHPKYGVEYDIQLIKCCKNSLFSILETLDLAVFVLEIKPENILMSANLLLEGLSPSLIKNRKFMRSVNSDIKIVVRIKFSKSEHFDFPENVSFNYLAHLKEYMVNWQKNDLLDESFVLEFFPDTIKANTYSLQNVQPILLESTERFAKHHMDNFKSFCQSQYLIRTTYSAFDDFIFKPNNIESLNVIGAQCYKHLNFNQYRKFKVYSMSFLVSKRENWEDLLEEIVNQRKKRNGLRFETLFFEVPIDKLPGKNFSAHALHVGSNSLYVDSYVLMFGKIGCYVPINNVESAVSLCGPLFRRSSVLYIEWSLEEAEMSRKLPKMLIDIKEQQLVFAQKYPQHKLLVGLMILDEFSNTFDERTIKRSSARQTVYCDVALQKLYESYDAILTFAEIHQLSKLVLQLAVHTGNVGGCWNSIETSKNVNRTATDFSLLVQRNVPSHISNQLKLSNQFECIKWSEYANENGIQFNNHNNFGAVINMKVLRNGTFSVDEIHTLLLIALSNFSYLEILVNDATEVKTLLKIVKSASNALRVGIEPKCLIKFPLDKLVSGNTLNSLDYNQSSLIGMHAYGWENYSTVDHKKCKNFWNSNINSTGIKYGILINSCIEEMNSEFVQIRTLEYIKLLNYVACNVTPIKPENHNKDVMQVFLDTLFYTQKYFQSFPEFKSVDIYFHLNFVNENCNGKKEYIRSFLRIVNDLNEHSKTYGVKYILPAFDRSQIGDCPLAWWRIDNSTDFANLSIYSERESEYFGRQTQLKVVLNKPNNASKDPYTNPSSESLIFIIIGSALFLLSLNILVIVWYKLKFSRKRHLTDLELDTFRNGCNFEYDYDVCDLLDSLKFDSAFEISKDRVELKNRIGRGRFGHVYKSLLNNEVIVAVKLPHNECLKESFMSMLVEVKILCYIGTHPFIVRFIGAYTEEVKQGKLYIITEYCENGCLHSYLRDQRSTMHMTRSTELGSIDINHFCRFSYQIAKGMAYIADKNVIHGDLSARNVLLTADLVCKVGDFGLSRRLYESPEYVKKTKGPIPWRWLAIESLKNRTFTTKSDVWSFGVTIWEIFTYCDLPYPSNQLNDEFIQELENGSRLCKPQYSTYVIHEKMLECWNHIPSYRPSFEQLANFFNALCNVQYES